MGDDLTPCSDPSPTDPGAATMSLRRLTLCTLLALCVAPARAASVTYNFIDASNAPHPGTIGAILTFASPPASPDHEWVTMINADILDLQVTDSAIAPTGHYSATMTDPVNDPVISDKGTELDSGDIDGGMGVNGIST